MFGPGHNNEVSTHFMEARCLARDAVMTDLKNGNMTHKHHNHKWGRRRLRISRPVILHTDPLWYDATKPACCWYMSIIGTALQMRCPDWPFRCFLEALAACAGICWDFGYGWIVHDDCFVQKDPVVCWSNGRCFLICDRCVASRETRADLSGQIFWDACFSLQVSKPKKPIFRIFTQFVFGSIPRPSFQSVERLFIHLNNSLSGKRRPLAARMELNCVAPLFHVFRNEFDTACRMFGANKISSKQNQSVDFFILYLFQP